MRFHTRHVATLAVALAFAAFLLPACGGGGGGATLPAVLPPAPDPAFGVLTGRVEIDITAPAGAPEGVNRAPLPGCAVTVVGTGLLAVTGADGAFTLRDVPVGTHALYAFHDTGTARLAWYQEGVAVIGASAVSLPPIRLVKAVEVVVQVRDGAAPVPGAETLLVGKRLLTGADGTARIPDVPVGAWTLRATRAGYIPKEQSLPVGAGGASATVTLEPLPRDRTPAPTITTDPPDGFAEAEIRITLACPLSWAAIRYTLDGTTPTGDVGTLYEGPFLLQTSATIKVVARAAGMTDSEVVQAVLRVEPLPRAALPEFTPAAGTLVSPTAVAITCATPGARIRFTTDGSIPSPTQGFEYQGPIMVDRATTIQAYARADGHRDSAAAAATYLFPDPARVAPPEFSLPEGVYPEPFFLELSCPTPGAVILYTLNDLAPTTVNATVYGGPIRLTGRVRVRAVATLAGLADSEPVAGLYTVTSLQVVEGPGFAPAPGVYHNGIQVALGSHTPGATIRYTLDGSAPTRTNGITYTAPIPMPLLATSSETTIRAFAWRDGFFDAAVTTGVFLVIPRVEPPLFDPAPTATTSPLHVWLATPTPGATLRYTLDGSDPAGPEGRLYEVPILLFAPTTVRAVAVKAGWAVSEMREAFYDVQLPVTAAPEFSPEPGAYPLPQTITLTSATPGATIRYTLGGTLPTRLAGTVYTFPFTLESTATVRAIAYRSDQTASEIVSGEYRIEPVRVATPVITPPHGTYGTPQTVSLACDTPGATIRYTVDGTAPSATNGIVYRGPFTASARVVVRAYATKANHLDSLAIQSTVALTFWANPTALPRFIFSIPNSAGISGAEFAGIAAETWTSARPFTVNGVPASGTARLRDLFDEVSLPEPPDPASPRFDLRTLDGNEVLVIDGVDGNGIPIPTFSYLPMHGDRIDDLVRLLDRLFTRALARYDEATGRIELIDLTRGSPTPCSFRLQFVDPDGTCVFPGLVTTAFPDPTFAGGTVRTVTGAGHAPPGNHVIQLKRENATAPRTTSTVADLARFTTFGQFDIGDVDRFAISVEGAPALTVPGLRAAGPAVLPAPMPIRPIAAGEAYGAGSLTVNGVTASWTAGEVAALSRDAFGRFLATRITAAFDPIELSAPTKAIYAHYDGAETRLVLTHRLRGGNHKIAVTAASADNPFGFSANDPVAFGDPGSTIGELIDQVNAHVPGAFAFISQGRLVISTVLTGSARSLAVSDSAGFAAVGWTGPDTPPILSRRTIGERLFGDIAPPVAPGTDLFYSATGYFDPAGGGARIQFTYPVFAPGDLIGDASTGTMRMLSSGFSQGSCYFTVTNETP